ncbi:hypothetical protein F5B22DRAFT_576462 [Xylaria bambusicola]|uniref:uncharacterized protein n=1 Tax=Xylaria bambusicola TaxID=326684 RepID=UPI0020081B6B|nr:uncharacterized protein F5B22DRAFT_576462 [Xylaria bambusicola]KAI0503068.1 hypothetical protein F5B22DRAFT_576462 [Xylaria bambusicola]
MEGNPKARSILEFLTHRNPHVVLSPDSNPNTHNPDFYWPREVRKWDEFHFENLEKIYEGQLMNAARAPRYALLHYPSILVKDCRIEDEPMTTSLITKWNDSIVSIALEAVKDELNPCIWVQKASKPDRSDHKQKVALRPDAGAYSIHEQDHRTKKERFPKDHKCARSWTSLKIRNGEHVDKRTGEWRPGRIRRNDTMPIRQAYTYSVEFGCRYGCLLTTEEAFVFRIRPRDQYSAEPGSAEELLAPQEAVKTRGLMEYVSIPWRHGTDENNDKYQKLTVNLALWVLHVLAGNHHQILDDYPDLHTEKLVLPIDMSEPTRRVGRKRSVESERDRELKCYPQKRTKTKISPDRMYLSFSTDAPSGTEVRPS